MVWKWLDDDGVKHKFTMSNLHCAPEGKVGLLSPQHWAKTQNNNKPIEGTGETTLSNRSALFWGQCQHKLTMPLGKADNVPTFRCAPGFTKHAAFCAECNVDPKEEIETPIEEAEPAKDDLEEEVCQKATIDRTCNHKSCSCSYTPDPKESEGVDQPTVWCTIFGHSSSLNG